MGGNDHETREMHHLATQRKLALFVWLEGQAEMTHEILRRSTRLSIAEVDEARGSVVMGYCVSVES